MNLSISPALVARLTAEGPKRILALDGGGIRGAISLGFLGEIEKLLAERYAFSTGKPADSFRLWQYFDLIGGTSTGAIIAGLLAITGLRVSEIKAKYLALGQRIFSNENGFTVLGRQIYFHGKYDSLPLKEELQKIFGDIRLGDENNQTGFCVITKRLDTCSTWPITNNPSAKYFAQNRFLIRDIVRASTAAPSFFEPELIDVGFGEEGVFVDGGLSMMNNPALQLFLTATLKGHQLNWTTGEDQLLIVSVGTGRADKKLIGAKWQNPNLVAIAKSAPEQLMSDANELVETMMHFIGKPTGRLRKVDSEIEDLSEDAIHGGKAFSYLRYNVEICKGVLADLGLDQLSDVKIASLMKMDQPENVDLLMKIGERAGRAYVEQTHFPANFDFFN